MMYVQCKLIKLLADGSTTIVSWLPKKFAVKGKILKLKEGDSYSVGWIVMEVSSIKLTEKEATEHSEYYRYHREFSDV